VAEDIATLSPVDINVLDRLTFDADVPTVKPLITKVVPSAL
jgi:hypothetical protein